MFTPRDINCKVKVNNYSYISPGLEGWIDMILASGEVGIRTKELRGAADKALVFIDPEFIEITE